MTELVIYLIHTYDWICHIFISYIWLNLTFIYFIHMTEFVIYLFHIYMTEFVIYLVRKFVKIQFSWIRIWIALFPSISHKTEFCSVSNQSEKYNHLLFKFGITWKDSKLIWIIFLCVPAWNIYYPSQNTKFTHLLKRNNFIRKWAQIR